MSPARGGRVDVLRKVPLFAGLGGPDLERLAGMLSEHTFSEGAVITREGERGARVLAFFVIAEGAASVVVGGEAKAPLGPGDHFGEIGLFYDVPRSATVSADSDLRCYAWAPGSFGRSWRPTRRSRGRSWRRWPSAWRKAPPRSSVLARDLLE